jgi:hypothetical protein
LFQPWSSPWCLTNVFKDNAPLSKTGKAFLILQNLSSGAFVGANGRLQQITIIYLFSLICHHLQFAQQLYHVLWRHVVYHFSCMNIRRTKKIALE